MLDLRYIRAHRDHVENVARSRGITVSLDKLLALNDKLSELRGHLERAQAERNAASHAMAGLEERQRQAQRASLKALGDTVTKLKQRYAELEQRQTELASAVPNIVTDDVPLDPNPEHNRVLRAEGAKPTFSFPPRDYLTIAEKLDLIDTARAAKVSGTRFGYLKGAAAELEFALVRFALDYVAEQGFIAVVPPVMVRDEVIRGVGYLEAGGTLERYHLDADGLYLVGSAEHALVPLHMNERLAADELPRRYAGFSTCFRREAGAAGKDTRGILRVHQFDKLELVTVCLPEHGDEEFNRLLGIEEGLLRALGLPYRIVQLVSGDIPFPLAKTYDVETWMPGQGVYRETHSCSTALDFQARRLNIRYQRGAERGFVHTLNATGLAIGRTLIAIIENYQTKKGFAIPKKLRPYLNGRKDVTAE
ncbi:MAG: serine--tRNA ligase [Candidatus Kerfeldbacteria bacterium]|nr:serine--tRNA ligase [Candidatus Kerfeldbacteria bacterium]